MRTYILLEYKRDITITKLGDQLVTAASRDQNQDIDTIIAALEQMDPTKNKQYVEWLARQYIRSQFRLEDHPRVNDVLVKFEQIKNKLDQRDINKYTFRSLEEIIDKEFNVKLSTRSDETDVPGANNLYNGPLGRLDVPITVKASKILGKGTKWCTAAEKNNMFEQYNEQGPLYVWRDKSGDKYQFHFETKQFMDSRDNTIPHDQLMYFRTKHPVLLKLFRKIETTYLSDASEVFEYARDVIKGKWPAGEKVLMNTPRWAFLYSRDVLHRRWKEGETIIATSPAHATLYAMYVLDGRFREAEPVIATNAQFAYQYARDIIEGEFPEGEPTLATDSRLAYWYARDVIKHRFPEGEPAIMKSEYASKYQEFVNSRK
jgi:hypothetical protein